MDFDGAQIGVITTSEALRLAEQRGMDLVEISPNAQPPVCRICDYGKYRYEIEKKEKQQRRHQSNTKVKEIKFHPNVEEHDYNTKLRHIRDFLDEGHRVKVSLMFRGRESAHQEFGYKVMHRCLKDVQDIAISERAPEQMGRTIYMLISPKPNTKKAGEGG